MSHEPRIALLIDADNSPADMIDEVLDELAKEGVINIRRAYGNWRSPHLNAWAACCTTSRSSRCSSLPIPRARTRPMRR
jgi:Protein of unknown function DUF88.